MACGSPPWGQRPDSSPERRRVATAAGFLPSGSKGQPLQPFPGVPAASPSRLPNACLLPPDHSYLPAFVGALHPSRIAHLQGAFFDYSGYRDARPQTHRTPASSDVHLDMQTSQCASCGCILITQIDWTLPEYANSLVSIPPPLHFPHLARDRAPNRPLEMNHGARGLERQESTPSIKTQHGPYGCLCAALRRPSLLLKGSYDPAEARSRCRPTWRMETWTRSWELSQDLTALWWQSQDSNPGLQAQRSGSAKGVMAHLKSPEGV